MSVEGAGAADVRIEEWTAEHARWGEMQDCVTALGQQSWFTFAPDWQHSSHAFAASLDGQVVGFLRLVVQAVGAEDDHSPVMWNGAALSEAKILAFGVLPEFRRGGIGQKLQEAALALAQRLGCYQARSHSNGGYYANHQLKLCMGFGVQPVVRGEDRAGVYFIMPLAHWKPRRAE